MSPSAPRTKMLQSLAEVHALEAAHASTLTAHIAMTPRGAYRSLLERHRAETLAQRERVQERLVQLGVTRSPLALASGIAQAVTGQVLSLAKAPLDLLRGASGEAKLLRNAKTEAASEALEIATYDALEALAEALGDPMTATLAREHRRQEEAFLAALRVQIGRLAAGVADHDVHGTGSYDLSTTGAADAARRVAGRVAGGVDGDRNADDGDRDHEGAGPRGTEVPIPGYDTSTVAQILPKLRSLSASELDRVDAYERSGRARKRILERVAALRTKQVDQELPTR